MSVTLAIHLILSRLSSRMERYLKMPDYKPSNALTMARMFHDLAMNFEEHADRNRDPRLLRKALDYAVRAAKQLEDLPDLEPLRTVLAQNAIEMAAKLEDWKPTE